MPLGTGGVSEVGHLLDYTPELVLGPARPPPGIGPHSVTSLFLLGAALPCKILPYMELKTASQCPTEPPPQPGAACRDSREVPSSQFCPPSNPHHLGLPASLAGCGLGTPSLLSVGPFLECVLPITLFSIQEIHLSPEPTQDQENEGIPWNKTLRRSRWSWPCLRACSPSLCFVPWDSSALLWGLSPH